MTSSFLARTASASSEIGGSVAVIAISWNRWLGTMSERAGPLVEFAEPLDADRLDRCDLDVVDMRAFQIGSQMPLAKRSTMTFCTVSFPRKWSIR